MTEAQVRKLIAEAIAGLKKQNEQQLVDVRKSVTALTQKLATPAPATKKAPLTVPSADDVTKACRDIIANGTQRQREELAAIVLCAQVRTGARIELKPNAADRFVDARGRLQLKK